MAAGKITPVGRMRNAKPERIPIVTAFAYFPANPCVKNCLFIRKIAKVEKNKNGISESISSVNLAKNGLNPKITSMNISSAGRNRFLKPYRSVQRNPMKKNNTVDLNAVKLNPKKNIAGVSSIGNPHG